MSAKEILSKPWTIVHGIQPKSDFGKNISQGEQNGTNFSSEISKGIE